MIHTIVDIILLVNILVLSALNRQIDRRINKLEERVEMLAVGIRRKNL